MSKKSVSIMLEAMCMAFVDGVKKLSMTSLVAFGVVALCHALGCGVVLFAIILLTLCDIMKNGKLKDKYARLKKQNEKESVNNEEGDDEE